MSKGSGGGKVCERGMKTGTMMPIPVKMKATVLGPNQLEVKEVPTPERGPMEALLEVEACACCCTHVARKAAL
jgi:hypothetical protein